MSSAKSLTLDLKCSVRSLMHARNKMGPRTEPWWTPEETVEAVCNYRLFSIVLKVFDPF